MNALNQAVADSADPTNSLIKIERAIISVSDKSGLIPFAKTLAEQGIEILSTGGTYRHLSEAQIPVTEVSQYTAFPEMMDGRLKTLHPKIFGGILARRDLEQDQSHLSDHGMKPIDLVVVNLYPFQQTVAREGVTDAEAIEQIDIGGPSLVRAAAKNHRFVAVLTSPKQYDTVANQIAKTGGTDLPTRRSLASDAFAHTASYDTAIAEYFTGDEPQKNVRLRFTHSKDLRYGENPHQKAAVYQDPQVPNSLVTAEQLNGKELSYNNYLDLHAALTMARHFQEPAVAVIKHNNPCGLAIGNSIEEALTKAMECDPTSAFGSILGFNRPVDETCAEWLAQPGLFIEAIIGPHFEKSALEILTTRPKWKQNVRLMQLPEQAPDLAATVRPIDGGILWQSVDNAATPHNDWTVPTDRSPSDAEQEELRFAWEAVRHVRSNAIVVCRNLATVGVGAGQMSRVDAVQIAIRKAGERTQSAVLASDAFFPFPDSIESAAQAGISAIVQPGGSKRDADVVDACNKHQISMVFTGRRHFMH